MRVIAVTSRKGGTGKSTIATHLSVAAGPKAALIDTDDQAEEGSSSAWMQARGDAPSPRFFSHDEFAGRGLDSVLEQCRSERASHVIVDTAPKADAEVARVMSKSDAVVIVTEPAFFPLKALARSIAIVRAANKPFVIAVNKVHNSRRESRETREALAGLGVPIVELANRVDLIRALAAGQAVGEFSPRSEAAQEIAALWKAIQGVMK